MNEKRYFAIELGRLTCGYDLQNQCTLIRRWSIAVTGPDDLSSSGLIDKALAQLEEDLRSSAEQAGYEAVMAAYAVPGDFSAKLVVAWELFWQRFPTLVEAKLKEKASQFINAFNIGLLEDSYEVSGLVLDATAGKATAQMYGEVYKAIGGQFKGDIGKAVNSYFEVLTTYNKLTTIEIHIEFPREITHVVAEATDAIEKLDDVKKALEDIPQRLVDLEATIEKEFQPTAKAIQDVVSGVALLVGGVGDKLAAQLQGAKLHIEFSPDVLKKLLPGEPRLDLKAATSGLERRLRAEAERLYTNLGNSINADIRAALGGLEAIRVRLQQAIDNCARDVVIVLKAEFDVASRAYDDARHKLDNLVVTLNAANLTGVANQLVTDAVSLTLQFVELNNVAEKALGDVEKNIEKAAEETARRVLSAAQDAVNAVRSAVGRVFGF